MHTAKTTINNKKDIKLLCSVFFVFILLKALLAYFAPFTTDEAYLVAWGKQLSLGYYEHPPMMGWIMYPFLQLGDSILIYRLPNIIILSLIGLSFFLILRKYDYKKSILISILFFLSPVQIFNFLIINDIFLLFFTFYSVVFLFLAQKNNDNLLLYILSGLFLSFSILTKYITVIVFLCYIIYFIYRGISRKRLLGIILLYLSAVPLILLHIYWNYTHSWINIIFHVYKRENVHNSNIISPALFILGNFYILTPPICYYFLKKIKHIFSIKTLGEFSLFYFVFYIPLFIFFVLSFVLNIGLHWLLPFTIFVYLLSYKYLTSLELRRCIIFLYIFTGIQVIIVIIIYFLTSSGIYSSKLDEKGLTHNVFSNLHFQVKHKEIRKYLNRYDRDFILTSTQYDLPPYFYLDSNKYSPAFGVGPAGIRQSDLSSDYYQYKNMNFLGFNTGPSLSKYKPYFEKVSEEMVILFGHKYYLYFCYNFNYLKYIHEVHLQIYNKYWKVPNNSLFKGDFYLKKQFSNSPLLKIIRAVNNKKMDKNVIIITDIGLDLFNEKLINTQCVSVDRVYNEAKPDYLKYALEYLILNYKPYIILKNQKTADIVNETAKEYNLSLSKIFEDRLDSRNNLTIYSTTHK